uniref:Uncharacterized protein n=1 Tax=Cyanothece sp. (strain PCC 7425 / ATCC 29141) TaxID=395961 RepID=B8HM85_CYAP4
MVNPRSKPQRKPLGEYLVEAGLLSPAQVEMILFDQQHTNLRFGEIAALRGWVKQETIEFLFIRVVLPERANLQKKSPSVMGSSPQVTPYSSVLSGERIF